jgi:hypothetical protein
MILNYAVNFTLSIDLSTSWTTSDVAPIVTLHQNGNNMLTRDASMFYDPISNMIYWYGGYPYMTGFQPSVWGFTTNNGKVSWGKIYDIGISQPTSGSTFPGFTFTTGSLWTSTPTAYYSLGGYLIGGADPAITGLGMTAVSGLVEYNFQEGLWTNSSDTGASGYREQGFSVHGEAVCVPIYGEDGIIVFLDGDIPQLRLMWEDLLWGSSQTLQSTTLAAESIINKQPQVLLFQWAEFSFAPPVRQLRTIPLLKCSLGDPMNPRHLLTGIQIHLRRQQ